MIIYVTDPDIDLDFSSLSEAVLVSLGEKSLTESSILKLDGVRCLTPSSVKFHNWPFTESTFHCSQSIPDGICFCSEEESGALL